MRNIVENIIKEILGVPNEFLDVDLNSVIDKFIDDLSSKIKNSPETDFESIRDSFTYEVNKGAIDNVTLRINFVQKDIGKLVVFSAGLISDYESDKGNSVIKNNGSAKIVFNVAYPIMYSTKMVEELNKIKPTLVKYLYHELKHYFDKNKIKNFKAKNIAKYSNATQIRINSFAFNRFMFYMYYTHGVETLVRNTELYGNIKTDNVDKKQFYQYLTSSKEYQKLKEIKDYTYDKFIDELLNEKDKIVEGFQNKNMSDQEFIDICEKQFIDIINTEFKSALKRIIKWDKSLLNNLEVNSLVNEILKETKKFKTFKELFNYELKKMNNVAEKTMKKMSKVYDLAKSNDNVSTIMQKINDKSLDEMKSIYEPELYDEFMINKKLNDNKNN